MSTEKTEPSPGLLMSMALRFDHALAMPGYYDQINRLLGSSEFKETHAMRLDSTLRLMRKLWEEMSGQGFYQPHLEAHYASLCDGVAATADLDRKRLLTGTDEPPPATEKQ